LYDSKYLALFFLILFNFIAHPQTSNDSLDFSKLSQTKNKLSSIFEKQLNTYSLASGFRYSSLLSNYLFGLSENFKSSYIKGIEKTVRDENQFQMFLINQYSRVIDFGLLLKNSILSDSRKLEINQSSISSLMFFSRLHLFNNKFIVTPNAGYSNNKQIGEDDNGAEYGLELETKNFDLYDFELDGLVKFRNEDISPRKNYLRNLDVSVSNYFDKNFTNRFNFRFLKSRKDFYFPADSVISQNFNIRNNIQSRTETHYLASDRFVFLELFNNLSFESEGRVSFRNVKRETRFKLFDLQSSPPFDTEVDELKLEFDALFSYVTEKLKSNIRFTLSERTEQNKVIFNKGVNQILFEQRKESEEQKNNHSIYGTITFAGSYQFSSKDKININLYQSKLRYDTPSILNDDDRDEILSIIRLEYYRIVNPFFSLFVNTEASQSHLVYIFASKSSNNNINRVIRLRTGSELNSRIVTSTNIFEVSANYTSYDFEGLNTNLRSFSYRQFSALDSTQVSISKRCYFNFLGYIKISEQGDFSWKTFSEKPRRYLRELFLEPQIEFEYESKRFVFGIRFFSLSIYNYKEKNRVFESNYQSYGPTTIIGIKLFNNLSISVQGYYEIVKLTNFSSRQQTSLNLNTNWNF
jgi:hypothetical protein